MNPRRSQLRSRRANKSAGVEWIGGARPMPVYVTGEGEPYRPDALVWIRADGTLLGSTVVKPGEVLPVASASLQQAMEHPAYGRPHRPARVRVASSELADELRAGHPGLEVVCAPTPELDVVFAHMNEFMKEERASELSFLSPEIEPEAMAAFFHAAAGLFRAQPWALVPDDHCLFSVTIDELDVRDSVLSVIGQAGQRFGFLLFSDLDDFELYGDVAQASEFDEADVPCHFALNFERGEDLVPALHEEIAKHGWEIADENAIPCLVAIDEDVLARLPTAAEVTMAEALARALTEVLVDGDALGAAWEGGSPFARTLTVATHWGPMEVTLEAPYEKTGFVFSDSDDLMAHLEALERADDEIDDDARIALEKELVRRFAAAREAAHLVDIDACCYVMDLAAHDCGRTIATLQAGELREVLFESIPRKVSIEPSAAAGIIDELRAFYAFLKREFDLAQADACLQVLGGQAVEELAEALADRSKFGMAKSLFMAGVDAGYDMDSDEGIAAWIQEIEGQPLPVSISMPGSVAPQPPKRKTAKAKKDKRKAARKSRRKNR